MSTQEAQDLWNRVIADIDDRLQRMEKQEPQMKMNDHLLLSHFLNIQELIVELTDAFAKDMEDTPLRNEIISRSVLYHEISRAIKENPDLKFLEQRSIGYARYNQKVDEIKNGGK